MYRWTTLGITSTHASRHSLDMHVPLSSESRGLHFGLGFHPCVIKIVSEYDQEIPQSQTADNPMTPREEEPLNHQETPGRQIKQSNQLSLFPIKMIAILEWT